MNNCNPTLPTLSVDACTYVYREMSGKTVMQLLTTGGAAI